MSQKTNQAAQDPSQGCPGNQETQNDFSANLNDLSKVKKVFAVISGKGGVGKSLVTSMMAVTMNKLGYKTAVLDADITGPSIPKSFGIKGKATANKDGIIPVTTKTGIDIMSVNLILANEKDPVVWRGPIIASTVKQFWSDVIWQDIDYMFIDLPPGTGDVPLTVFQSLPVDGIIVVTSPQELVSMIVSKAVKMAEMMDIPILGLVENMSYFKCPDNNKKYKIFGESHIEEIAQEHALPVLAKIPIDPKISQACDRGEIEDLAVDFLKPVADCLLGKSKEEKAAMKIAVASDGDSVTEHFGHCPNFNIYQVENKQIIASESIPNPGHKPGFLPNFLNDLGVDLVISGGMGAGAIDIFTSKDIEVIVGASGKSREAVETYLAGSLQSTGDVCNEHRFHDECGE